MKFGVVIFPGSNCDQDMIYVLRNIMQQEVVELWHKDTDLQNVDFIVLPGGFSYGDYLRSGAIARFSPIMEKVIEFAHKGGYVMGVCNGFQVLCESGLLPGTLQHNNSHTFICKNVHLKPGSHSNALTAGLEDKAYKIPIAHGEGRYFADEATLKELQDNEQILFYYSDAEGQVNEQANPNGSLHNIAGVTNKTRNVFGMMPHPERAADSNLGNTDGRAFFESLLKNLVPA
ncbi:MAG: phosphoribosylformylglycinamidine synthase I [Owenweeksia sp.]|nr:phosphoribosylformylglycinamidine synthase I [Owenweeksia sp.]MBF98452.1 phosphoribosylformylglycinamidine synthase I [Owenweeksia sp.]HBF18697.1 phosphoribosylformylglycinamidine synthase I [Cryomorphaceae bacterium]HCQ16295.1 phosphoribosylformylglycinamidine synthase I [Cryomorphaceae bacterium]|tara:strand:- start:2122 stop:2814 length:693 start_codon:yes stop_codon:yes gene_type:complete